MGIYDRDYLTVQDARNIGTFSSRVYGWMALGLAFTAFIAYTVYHTGLYMKLMPFWWVLAFATFGVAMSINAGLKRFSISTVATLFLAYAGLEGLIFGTVLPLFAKAYGGQVIWAAFLSASAIFGTAMLYGVFTKSDLTSLSRILSLGLMGLMGITLVYVVLSFFMHLPLMNLIISYLGLVIFVGLTAYDAQTIRQYSRQVDVHSVASYKLSMMMALKMYVNVIMIFWYLLQIFASNSRKS